MIGRTTTFTKALAALAAAALASAGRAAPGDGIRFGGSDARLHPFLDVEARYDSNVTFTPANEAISDLILHVRPGLELLAPGELLAVEFRGVVDRAQYLGIDRDTTKLSNTYGSAALAAVLNRSGSLSPRLDNSFERRISTTSLAASSSAVVSNVNTLSLSIPWKPGGGALVVAANGQWIVESFDRYLDVAGPKLSDLGFDQYRAGGEVQWRFLPRTSAVLGGGWYAIVPNASDSPNQGTGYDVMTGVTGLLTERVATTAKIGFGSNSTHATAVVGAKTTSTVLADLALEWLPLDTLSVKAGYIRSLGVDPTVAGYISDGVSGGVKVKVAERFAVHAGARWDRFAFQGQELSGASTSYLSVDPGIDGQFGRWLTVGVGYVLSRRTASWPIATVPPPDYTKHEAFARVGVTY